MEIKEVGYEFDPDAVLFGIEPKIYDFDASVTRYVELCEAALCRAYPEAAIKIRKAFGTRTQYLVNGSDEHTETSAIENICDEIRQEEDDYKVKRSDIDSIRDAEQLAPIDTISKEFDISIGILRWSCKNQLIKDANRSGLIWLLTRLNLHNFQRVFLKGSNDASIWRIKRVGAQVASITGLELTEFLQQRIVDVIADEASVLISSELFTMPMPFSTHNSYILVSNINKQNLITIELFDDVERWENSSTHTFSMFRNSLSKRTYPNKSCKIRRIEESNNKNKVEYSLAIDFVVENSQERLETCIEKGIVELRKLVEDTEIELAGGLPWDKNYEEDEKPFQKYLRKLVEKLDYEAVKLEHGSFEFGKDIIFADTTKFGIRQYYAIQAKKGDLSGNAKSAIDEILTQMEDAFTVPFREDQTLEHKYISAFIIAISGEFTHNAKEKIWARLLRQGRVGLVYLWDRNVVQDLMRIGSLRDKNKTLSARMLQNMMPDFLDQNKERR